jgi:hypothetical protein
MKSITTLQPYIIKIHSSIILPPTLCSAWSGFSGRGDYGFFLFHLLHCPPVSHLKHLDFIITNYVTPYYAILCCLHHFQIFSSAPHSQPSLQPLIQDIAFHTHKDSGQYYSSVYFSLYVFRWKMGMSSSTVKIYQDFRGIYCLHPQGRKPEDGNRSFHQNSKFLTGYMMSHPLKKVFFIPATARTSNYT